MLDSWCCLCSRLRPWRPSIELVANHPDLHLQSLPPAPLLPPRLIRPPPRQRPLRLRLVQQQLPTDIHHQAQETENPQPSMLCPRCIAVLCGFRGWPLLATTPLRICVLIPGLPPIPGCTSHCSSIHLVHMVSHSAAMNTGPRFPRRPQPDTLP